MIEGWLLYNASLAGQRDIAAKIGTVPPDSGRLTGMN